MARKIRVVQLRTTNAGDWIAIRQPIDNDQPLCEVCGADLWAMGTTIYCNNISAKHIEVAQNV
jgi:hypothetical protein